MQTIDTTAQAALSLAEQGFRVFPLVEGAKTPAIDDFPNAASADPAVARRRWAPTLGEPDRRNVGIATGRGLMVVDVDMKAGQRGAESLFYLNMLGLPETRTIRTASGGVHLYFRVPEECRIANSVGKIAKNVDVRGEGGYVVAPGSVTAAGQYSIQDDRPIAEAPDWLIRDCSQARDRSADSSQPLVELDRPDAVSRAIDWLKTDAEPSFKGAGGDAAAYRAACGVRDFGVSEEACLDLLLDHWNERGAPQWAPDRLAVKVANAYRYALQPAGVASPDVEFGVLPPEPAKPSAAPKLPKFQPITFNESADLAESCAGDPLVEGLLDRGAMGVIYGASNVGKTFVVMDIAYHVATGREWNGREVTRSPVVYVVAEGGRQIHKRTAALRKRFGGEDAQFDLIVHPVNLLKAEVDLKDLIAAVATTSTRYGAPVELIVLDTLSRVLAGGDENSSVDMGALVHNLDKLRAATGAHLAIVHHTGKDKARGARGHSSLRAAIDTEIEVAKGSMQATKQRDKGEERGLTFQLSEIQVGIDHKGRPVVSATVDWKPSVEFAPLPVTGAEAEAQARLSEWSCHVAELAARDGVDPATRLFGTGEIVAFFTDPARPAPLAERTVKRQLVRWREAGEIQSHDRGLWRLVEVPSCHPRDTLVPSQPVRSGPSGHSCPPL